MIRNLFTALAERLTSAAVGAALTWLAATLHIVIDPSSQPGLVVLAVAVLTAAYDLAARLVAKRVPALAPFLGVSAASSKPTRAGA